MDSTSDSGATLTISPKSADGLSYAVTVGMDENFTIAVKDHEDYSYTDPTPASGTFVNGAATVEATAMKLIDYTFYVNWNDNATANRPNSVTYTLQSNTADSEW